MRHFLILSNDNGIKWLQMYTEIGNIRTNNWKHQLTEGTPDIFTF